MKIYPSDGNFFSYPLKPVLKAFSLCDQWVAILALKALRLADHVYHSVRKICLRILHAPFQPKIAKAHQIALRELITDKTEIDLWKEKQERINKNIELISQAGNFQYFHMSATAEYEDAKLVPAPIKPDLGSLSPQNTELADFEHFDNHKGDWVLLMSLQGFEPREINVFYNEKYLAVFAKQLYAQNPIPNKLLVLELGQDHSSPATLSSITDVRYGYNFITLRYK